jgi:hypothetical protein
MTSHPGAGIAHRVDRPLRFGPRSIRFPGRELAALPAFAGSRDDGAALRASLARDGFLYLRGMLPGPSLAAVRQVVRPVLARAGEAALDRMPEVSQHPALSAVIDGAELRGLFGRIFGEPVRSHHHRFLRATSAGVGTGAHMDAIYMGRGDIERLLTCWIALDDAPLERGPLAILRGSHDLRSFAILRERYATLDFDRDRLGDLGWYSPDPLSVSERFGGCWASADFAAGDVVVFGMRTMHASLINLGPQSRLSCDVRFQPASTAADARWADPGAPGHDAWHRPVETVPMREVLQRLDLA